MYVSLCFLTTIQVSWSWDVDAYCIPGSSNQAWFSANNRKGWELKLALRSYFPSFPPKRLLWRYCIVLFVVCIMIGKLKQNLLVACLVISSVTVFYLGRHAMECHHRIEERGQSVGIYPLSALGGSMRTTLRTGQNLSTPFVYNKDMPLIFIGGVPRSGTTLMRAMLDAHPEVRCGEETRVIPRILAMKQMWSRSGREKMRLDEAGVTDEVLDAAMQAFLLEIIVKHGEPANFLCNKDPFSLKSLSYLAKIFPHAKFVLMIRDGRASVHSMISRKVTIAGFDLGSYRDCLTKWNRAIETMYTQCLEAADKCLPVHYEQLVLHPEKWMKTLLKFLEVPWNDAVLRHEELIGKAGGVSLSK